MKRNKHTNVAPQADMLPEGNTMIMSDSTGNLVQASNIKLTKEFADIAERITKAKGGTFDPKVKALLEMTEIWTPDMVTNEPEPEKPKPSTTEETPKFKKTARKPRKKTTESADENPKKPAKKAAKTTVVSTEEKPKPSTTEETPKSKKTACKPRKKKSSEE